MEIHLKQGKEELQLPVLPSGYEISRSINNTEVNITNYGTVNIIGNKGLRSTTLSSFFPNHEYNFVQYKGFPKPKECVKLIESWINNPIEYIVTGTNINMIMTIEEFTYSEQDGSGDIYYSLALKEYVIPKLTIKKKVEISSKKSKKVKVEKNVKRPTKTVKTTTYVVKHGDTLSSIAKKLTGNANNYRAIANQNNIKNVNRIYVGQKLVIKI